MTVPYMPDIFCATATIRAKAESIFRKCNDIKVGKGSASGGIEYYTGSQDQYNNCIINYIVIIIML